MPGGPQKIQAPLEEPHLKNIEGDPKTLEGAMRVQSLMQQQTVPRAVKGLHRAALSHGAGAAMQDL
jgi:hypothetical protein